MPDRGLANHVFDAAAAVAVFDTGSEAFFPDSPHLETIPVETLPMTNVTHKLFGFRTTTARVTAPSSYNT